jgi:hypothetical protein
MGTRASRSALRMLVGVGVALAVACGDDGTSRSAPAGLPMGADHAWTWHEFPDAFCRDGSRATIAVSPSQGSKKLMIFLEGGGACFDALSCLANPANTSGLFKIEKNAGLFNRTRAENPVGNWNYVYVPYCTGDVHAGTNAEGSVQGVQGTQKFVGYDNMSAYLKRIVPTFPDTERVLFVGSSAGGFGAAANVPQVLRAFPKAAGNLIDDSGPPMPENVLPSCLQQKWRDTWGLRGSMLKECGEDCPDDSNFVFDFGLHLAKIYSKSMAGTIEAAEDGIIRSFFGAGANDCTSSILSLTPAISGADFTEGLLAFRDAVSEYPNFGTYYPPGTQHTWLSDDTSVYDTSVNGVKLVDWVRGIVTDEGTQHVGP